MEIRDRFQSARVQEGRVTLRGWEAYVQDDIFWGERLEVLVGGRLSAWRGVETHFSPKLQLFYALRPTLRLRVGVADGFRMADPNERFADITIPLGPSGTLRIFGDPNLRPEKSVSLQASLEWGPVGGHLLRLQAYQNRVRDMIEPTFQPQESGDGLLVYRYQNIAQARTRGLELQWWARWSAQWESVLNLHFRQAESADVRLPFNPAFQLQGELRWRERPWDARLRVLHFSKQRVDTERLEDQFVPPQTLLYLEVGYRMGGVRYYFGVRNLTNRLEPPYGNQEPRRYYFGIAVDQ